MLRLRRLIRPQSVLVVSASPGAVGKPTVPRSSVIHRTKEEPVSSSVVLTREKNHKRSTRLSVTDCLSNERSM